MIRIMKFINVIGNDVGHEVEVGVYYWCILCDKVNSFALEFYSWSMLIEDLL